MRRPLALICVLSASFGCELEDRDAPPPFEGGATVGAGGVLSGVGGQGVGGQGGATSTTTGAGGSSSSGLGVLLAPHCGCLQNLVEGTEPACATCLDDAKILECSEFWDSCQSSTLCQQILAALSNCPVPFDQLCIDTAVFMNGPGVGVLASYLQCACVETCSSVCTPQACQ